MTTRGPPIQRYRPPTTAALSRNRSTSLPVCGQLRQLTDSYWQDERRPQMATYTVGRTAPCETLDTTRKAQAGHRLLSSRRPEDDSGAALGPPDVSRGGREVSSTVPTSAVLHVITKTARAVAPTALNLPTDRDHRKSPPSERHRFIPARAGNTSRAFHQSRARTVHPRSRGEHEGLGSSPNLWAGSSPLARGTQAHWTKD
jgi:hypothetical protein